MDALQRWQARRAQEGRPSSLTWELTWDCPLHCVHCYLEAWRRRAPPPVGSSEALRVLNLAADLGVLSLALTGGEPLLHPEALRLAREARKRQMVVTLLSAASHLSPRQAREVAKVGFRALHISLLGDEPVHDQLCRLPGAWRRTIQTVRLWCQWGENVVLQMPVMRQNASAVGYVAGVAQELGCGFSASMLLFGKAGCRTAPVSAACPAPVAGEAADEVWRALLAAKPELGRPLSPAETHTCGAGVTGWALDPAANVFPCTSFRVPVGNLLQDHWRRIAEQPLLRDLRAFRPEDALQCRDCPVQPHCKRCAAKAHQETGSWRGKAPSLCASAHRLARVSWARQKEKHGKPGAPEFRRDGTGLGSSPAG